jgi:hypothetical protein
MILRARRWRKRFTSFAMHVGVSEWHKRHSSRPFDFEDFCVWADHWILMHPIVTEIAALDDRDVLRGQTPNRQGI